MDYKIITHCRGCGSEIRHENSPAFSYGNVPLAGNFCKTHEAAVAAQCFPLALICCSNCETVQVQHDIDDKLLFSEYNYASSTVAGLNRHFIYYSEFLAKFYKEKKEMSFLEIGCNDGVLLKKLPPTWKRTGVDPSDVAKQYWDGSYELYNEPFSKEFVDRQKLNGTYDAISGSNCLAHISDIKNVFEGAWLALKEDGDFFIEVHDLYATINGNQWETLYHEHKLEWDIDSLKNCLIPLGFVFINVDHLPLHGGLIRAQFKKSKKIQATEIIRKPLKTDLLKQLHNAYLKRYDHPVIRQLQKENPDRIIAYGASGRAVMFLNHLNELHFNFIVDDSEIRIGKYIPVVGTKVISTKQWDMEASDFCLVTAWNYFEDIVKNNPEFKGSWLKFF